MALTTVAMRDDSKEYEQVNSKEIMSDYWRVGMMGFSTGFELVYKSVAEVVAKMDLPLVDLKAGWTEVR